MRQGVTLRGWDPLSSCEQIYTVVQYSSSSVLTLSRTYCTLAGGRSAVVIAVISSSAFGGLSFCKVVLAAYWSSAVRRHSWGGSSLYQYRSFVPPLSSHAQCIYINCLALYARIVCTNRALWVYGSTELDSIAQGTFQDEQLYFASTLLCFLSCSSTTAVHASVGWFASYEQQVEFAKAGTSS